MGSLIEVLGHSGKLKGMADAIKIAGLVDMLNSDGPFTILAPNDEAIAQVPRSYFNTLLEDKNKLKDAVLFHVIEGDLDSTNLEEMLASSESVEIQTMEGHKVVFRRSGTLRRHFTVNEATIASTDLKADNGIIHTIDAVLFVNEKP